MLKFDVPRRHIPGVVLYSITSYLQTRQNALLHGRDSVMDSMKSYLLVIGSEILLADGFIFLQKAIC